MIILLFSDHEKRNRLDETASQCLSGRNPCARGGWGQVQSEEGALGRVDALWAQEVMRGSFHPQQSPLVLQDLPCVCRLVGEAKIDSWHQILDLGSSLLNRLLCLPSDSAAAASHRGILAEVLLVWRKEYWIDLLGSSRTECSFHPGLGESQFCWPEGHNSSCPRLWRWEKQCLKKLLVYIGRFEVSAQEAFFVPCFPFESFWVYFCLCELACFFLNIW